MSSDRYTGVGSRKSHRKSRLGCTSCKKRRIKCDETKPECSNCVRHSLLCNYTTSGPNRISHHLQVATPRSHGNEASPHAGSNDEEDLHFEWDSTAVELMHNYATATCYTLRDDYALQSFFQVDVPQIGFSHKHVLHLILGLSALHLSRFKSHKRAFYLEHADRHYDSGFRIASRLIQDVNSETCHSLFLFASMCNTLTLAKGPHPGNFLLFDDSGPAEWISLFRGIKPVLDSHGEDIQNGILAPIMRAGISAAIAAVTELPPLEADQLARLRALIESNAMSPDDIQTLIEAVDNLHTLFSPRIGIDGRKVSLNFHSLGIWLYRCSKDFTTLLHKHQPGALAIFAHACLPLNDLSSNWVMAGWIPHLLAGIWQRLPREYRFWIQWPIQQIGWVPPDG